MVLPWDFVILANSLKSGSFTQIQICSGMWKWLMGRVGLPRKSISFPSWWAPLVCKNQDRWWFKARLNSFRFPQKLTQQSFRDDVIVLLCKLVSPSSGGSQCISCMLSYPYSTPEAQWVVLVTVEGTIKIRLWFLKFIFIQLRTHTLLCICCVYNIMYHVYYILQTHRYKSFMKHFEYMWCVLMCCLLFLSSPLRMLLVTHKLTVLPTSGV